ncbi:hypothetical protein [Methanosarcina sp. WH1]|uniref:hypothetical protein n=1 Tax=Methanosarcina sp. WH1 TaxID=1434102 RepID=UPI00061561FC|nr:hypothetical protein [Methanosarcina sp. WH1]AKB22712.1 hypothetical protein MSWH1_2441 [Methanosarcina sp. WH1]
MNGVLDEFDRFFKMHPSYSFLANLLIGGFLINILAGYLPSIFSVSKLLKYIIIILILIVIVCSSHFVYLKSKTINIPKTIPAPKTKYKGLIVSISSIKDKGDLINRINCARDSVKNKNDTKELELLFKERGVGQTLRAIIYHLNSLDVCWLLCTEQSLAAKEVVEHFIKQFKPSVHIKIVSIEDPFNLKSTRKIVREIYLNELKRSNLEEREVISDITGGTTPMSGAIILECNSSVDRDMQYTEQNENPELIDIEHP